MRVFLVLASAALTPAVATDARPVAKAEKQVCENHGPQVAAKAKAFGARPLAQEPDARHLQAVVRYLDGCSRPIALEENIGIRGRSGLIKPIPRVKPSPPSDGERR